MKNVLLPKFLLLALTTMTMLFGAASTQAQEIFRIQNRYQTTQEINVENGLASSATQPGWNSAMWNWEAVGSTQFIRIKNLWTKQYLGLVNGTPTMGVYGADDYIAQWDVEPVAGTAYFRLRNRSGNFYLNNETGPLVAGPALANWWSANWKLAGYTGPGANVPDSQWMRKNAPLLADKPLNKLVLPGTHDSATYDLQTTYLRPANDAFAPDTDDTKRGLSFAGELGYNVWARAQQKTILQSLNDGIRYIDLRICVDRNNNLMTCHGLYAATVSRVLDDIATFASQNPREIVIVQFQHVYDWGMKDQNGKANDASYTAISDTNKEAFYQLVQSKIGQYLVPKNSAFGNYTASSKLNEIWAAGKQIIVVTDAGGHLNFSTSPRSLYFWSASQYMDYHWTGETVDKPTVLSAISGHLASGPVNGKFMAIPFSLSPTGSDYGKSFDPTGDYPSSLRSMAKQVNPVLLSYLTTEWKGMHPNIISTDFYDESCLISVTKSLNGVPAPACNNDRNQKWGSWKVGYEKIADAFSKGGAIETGLTTAGNAIQYAFTGNPEEYTVQIDNCHSDLTGTDSTDTITLYLYDDKGSNFIQQSVAGSGSCSTNISITTSTKVTAFALGTSGQNAFYIDEVKLWKGYSAFTGELLNDSGRNNGSGWCLSLDPADAPDWGPNMSGRCEGILRFPQ